MKKVSLFFAALFVSAVLLTSCGGGAKTECTGDSTATEEVIPADVQGDSVAADTTQIQ